MKFLFSTPSFLQCYNELPGMQPWLYESYLSRLRCFFPPPAFFCDVLFFFQNQGEIQGNFHLWSSTERESRMEAKRKHPPNKSQNKNPILDAPNVSEYLTYMNGLFLWSINIGKYSTEHLGMVFFCFAGWGGWGHQDQSVENQKPTKRKTVTVHRPTKLVGEWRDPFESIICRMLKSSITN